MTIPDFSRKSQSTRYGFNILQLQAQENITVKNYADGEILCDKKLNSLRYLFDYLGIGVDEGKSCPFIEKPFTKINNDVRRHNFEFGNSDEIFNISNIHDVTLNVGKHRIGMEGSGWSNNGENMGRDLGELGTTAVLEIILGSYIHREHNDNKENYTVYKDGVSVDNFYYQKTPYFVFENFRIYKASPQFNFRASSDSTSLMKVKVGFSWTKMKMSYRDTEGSELGDFGEYANPRLNWLVSTQSFGPLSFPASRIQDLNRK